MPDDTLKGKVTSSLMKMFGKKPGIEMPGGNPDEENEIRDGKLSQKDALNYLLAGLACFMSGSKKIEGDPLSIIKKGVTNNNLLSTITDINKKIENSYSDDVIENTATKFLDTVLAHNKFKKFFNTDSAKPAINVIDVERKQTLENIKKMLTSTKFNVAGMNNLVDQEEEVNDSIKHSNKTATNNAIGTIQVIIDSTNVNLEEVETNLDAIIESIKNLNEQFDDNNGAGLISNFNNLARVLKSLYDSIDKYGGDSRKPESFAAKIKELKQIIGGEGGITSQGASIKGIIKDLNELDPGDVHKNVIDTFDLLNSVSNLLKNIEDLNTIKSKRNLANLIDIFVGSRDSFINLFKNLENLTISNADEIDDALTILSSFIDSITSILTISPFKVIKAKLSLWLINELLVDSIQEIIKSLKDTEKNIESDQTQRSFEVFNTFIDSVIKLAEVSIADKNRMLSNVIFIKDFVSHDIMDMIEFINKKLKNSSENAKDAVNAFTELLDDILKIKDLKDEDIENMYMNVSNLNDLIRHELKDLLEGLDNVFMINERAVDPKALINKNEDLKEILGSFNKTFDSLLSIKSYLSTYIKLTLLNSDIDNLHSFIKNINKLDKKQTLDKVIESSLPKLKTIFQEFSEVSNSIKSIDSRLFDKVDQVIKIIEKLDKLSKFAAVSKVSTMGLKALSAHVDTMIDIINSFKNVRKEHITKANLAVNALMKIVIGSAAILLVAGAVMAFVEMKNLIRFSIALTILLYSITGTFNAISKKLKNSLRGAKDATLLVMGSGMILLIGGLLMNYIDPQNLIIFTGTLSVFLFSLMGIFWLFRKSAKFAMLGAKEAVIFVGGAAMIMLIGSMLIGYVNLGNLVIFTLTLSVFLMSLLTIFAIFRFGAKVAFTGMNEAVSLIVGAGFILILGSLIWPYINKEALIEFGATLMMFVGGIMFFFAIARRIARGSIIGAKEVSKLITRAALILILGSIIWPYIDKDALKEFALTLALFIGGVMVAFGIGALLAKRAIKSAWQITLLIAVSAAILMYGSYLISKNIIDINAIVMFGVVLVGFILVISLVAALLYFGKKFILIGTVVMAVIMLFTLLAVYTLNKISEVALKENFLKNIGKGVLAMLAVIVSIAGAAGVIGAIALSGAWLPLLIGGIVITAILGIVILAANTLNKIADVMNKLKEVDVSSTKNLFKVVETFISLVMALEPLGSIKLAWTIRKASWTISNMVPALSKMAQVIKTWSVLKIPIYEGTKIVGYETITSDAFPQAAKNIKLCVTTLSQAIIDTYNEAPELFETNWLGTSKFSKVANSIKKLGPMLSSVAKGVKSWAKLTIPVYEGTKVVGYETITSDAFKTATKNIKQAVITLAQGIVEAYDEKPDLFETGDSFMDQLTGTTKFGKVARSLKALGPMLSSIAKGIKEWSDLRIPVYKPNSAEIQTYVNINDAEFKKASKNIKQSVLTLAQGVMEAYDENPKFFEFDEGILWGIGASSPFMKVAKSMKALGPMLSSIAKGIKEWADLNIPVYKPNSTEIQTYIGLTSDHFKKTTKNIKDVTTCLAEGVIEAYESNSSLFEFDDGFLGTGLGASSPFMKVAKSFKELGSMLNGIGRAIQMWADLKIPKYKENSTEIETYIGLTSDHFARVGSNISAVVTCLAKGLIRTIKNNEKMFDDGDEDSPINIVIRSLMPMGKLLKDIGQAVQMWADLKIPIYEEGNTEPVSYMQLTNDHFDKVGTNISKVVGILAAGVAELYKLHPEYFKSDAWHGLGKSPIAKVAASCKPMGEMLLNIAKAVQMWSELDIPKYNEKGEIVGHLHINDSNFDEVAKNISKVVGILAYSVASLYEKHKDYFNSDAWHGFGDSPIAKVSSSLVPMGEMLESIANGIKFWAELKIPKYGKDGKIIGYVELGKDEFRAVGINIAVVTTVLARSILNTVKDFPELFTTDEKSNAVLNAVKAIKVGGDALASIARTVGNYASGKFQVLKLDKNGKWVGGETITLDETKLKKLKINVEKVITALGSAIIQVYNDHKNDDVFFETVEGTDGIWRPVKKDAPITVVANSILVIADALNKSMDAISKLVELDTNDALTKLGDLKSGLIGNFKKIFEAVLTLGSILGSASASVIRKWIGIDGKEYQVSGDKFISMLNGWTKNSGEITRAFNSIKNAYEKILTAATNLIDSYESNQTPVDKLLNNKDNLKKQLTDVFELFTELSSLFDISKISSTVKAFVTSDEATNTYITKFTGIITHNTYITKFTGIITHTLTKIESINTAFEDLKEIKVEEIKQAFTDLKSILDSFDALLNPEAAAESMITKSANQSWSASVMYFNNLSNAQSNFTNSFQKKLTNNEDTFKLLSKKIDLIKKTAKSIISLGEEQESLDPSVYIHIANGIETIWTKIEAIKEVNAENIENVRTVIEKLIDNVMEAPPFELFRILADGLSYVYKATAEFGSVTNFKSHTEWLEKYIKAVNALSNINMTSLIRFVESVDKLSQRLGDLDKLTDAIGNKLAAVLCELVNQLHKADASIENAHKLQKVRQNLINESLNKVREIMSQHMIVEISQSTDTTTADTSTMPSPASGDQSTTKIDPEGTEIGLESNNGSQNVVQSGNAATTAAPAPEVHNGYQALTEERFVKLCKDIFKAKFRTPTYGGTAK